MIFVFMFSKEIRQWTKSSDFIMLVFPCSMQCRCHIFKPKTCWRRLISALFDITAINQLMMYFWPTASLKSKHPKWVLTANRKVIIGQYVMTNFQIKIVKYNGNMINPWIIMESYKSHENALTHYTN